MAGSLLFAVVLVAFSFSAVLSSNYIVNPKPIIGILSIEVYGEILRTFPNTESYIAADYVKYIEMAGGRVVPIFGFSTDTIGASGMYISRSIDFSGKYRIVIGERDLINHPSDLILNRINRTDSYYENIFSSINGVLFPGGGFEAENSSIKEGYLRSAMKFFQMAEKANEKGDFFPIWGTCLGFEVLAGLLANYSSILVKCDAEDVALPLRLVNDFQTSRLFYSLPDDVYYALITKNVTGNYHKQCLTPKAVKESQLKDKIKILSVNNDSNGEPFVSTYEAINSPYYGVQWHPEKSPFEWTSLLNNVPHSPEAIRVAQHFANFFVNEARKNAHHFPNITEENLALIANYQRNLHYLIDLNVTMAERYLFNHTDL